MDLDMTFYLLQLQDISPALVENYGDGGGDDGGDDDDGGGGDDDDLLGGGDL